MLPPLMFGDPARKSFSGRVEIQFRDNRFAAVVGNVRMEHTKIPNLIGKRDSSF